MRQDQLDGLYERWGGTPNTLMTQWTPSAPNPVFAWLTTLVQGQPFDLDDSAFPALFLLAPDSKETRKAAQMKWIDYELQALLVHQAPPSSQGDRASALITTFYGWLDAIGDQIRGTTTDPGAKILTTQAHPDGLWDATTGNASIKFGELFTIKEEHWRLENYLVIAADIHIVSTEQVLA